MNRTVGVILASFGLLLSASAGTATWSNSTANAPGAAYLWQTPGNWQGDKPGAAGDDVTANPTAPVYARTADGVAIQSFSGNENFRLLGDLTLKHATARIQLTAKGGIYGETLIPADDASDQQIWLVHTHFCGPYRNLGKMRTAQAGGTVAFRFDKYATAGGELRTGDLDGVGEFGGFGNGTFEMRGPVGAAAATGTWRLTEGSPYATRVSSVAHPLAVGTAVTVPGDGREIFLKRVFDDATIELSEAAAASGDVELSFAAFTPNFTATFPKKFVLQSNGGLIALYKTREQDVMRVVFPEVEAYQSGDAVALAWGSTTASDVVGTFVLGKVSGTGKEAWHVRNARFEFAGAEGVEKTVIPANVEFRLRAGFSIPLTAAEGKTGVIENVADLSASVTKDGAGTVRAVLSVAKNDGSVTVEEGTFEFVRAAALADAVSLKKLTVRSGATVRVPAEGLNVETMVVEPGAIIQGPGTLTVTGSSVSFDGVIFKDEATLGVSPGGAMRHEAPTGAVIGTPALWLDAKAASSLTLDGTGVLKWKDCRAALAETVFCTNIVRKPTYVSGDTPYVKLTRVESTSHANLEMLVWANVIRNIKAVFMAVDPEDGGGVMLGRTMRISTAEGGSAGPFYRAIASTTYNNYAFPLIYSSYSAANVRAGTFYLNGDLINCTKDGYSGPGMQILEGHFPSTGTLADAFGCSYADGGAEVKYNGCQRIGECIVYTNALTEAERLQVAQYLSQKWCGRDIRYREGTDKQTMATYATTDGGFSLPAGQEMTIERMTGTGTFVKDGAGRINVKDMTTGGIHVKGGILSLRSLAMTSEDVPAEGRWVHFDAANEEKLDTYTSGDVEYLNEWKDLGGDAMSLRKSARTTCSADAKVLRKALNGLPVVDTGNLLKSPDSDWGLTTHEPYRLLEIMKNGSRYAAHNGSGAPKIYSAFIVFGSQGGGNSILGARGDNHWGYGLSAYPATYTESPDCLMSSFGNNALLTKFRTGYNNGKVMMRLNGKDVNPFTTKFSGGYDLLTFAAANFPRQTQSLACSGYDNWTGGLRYGEVILFTRWLSEDEINRVEAYLNKKWFNRDTAGYTSANLSSLCVDADATLQVEGAGAVTVAGLSGAGTVAGKVRTTANAVFDVPVANGQVPMLTIGDEADLSEGGTVRLTGDSCRTLGTGRYAILKASGLTEDILSKWTVELQAADVGRRTCALALDGDTLYVEIGRYGFSVIIR